jgi:putative transposase
LLSDNGPAFIAEALAEFLKPYDIQQLHGRPHHPQTQGKIERYHRSMKSIVLLNTFYFPWELEQAIADFVAYYNTQRYHESLDNVTPADVFFGRQEEVLTQREIIKQQTLLDRRSLNLHPVLHIVQ